MGVISLIEMILSKIFLYTIQYYPNLPGFEYKIFRFKLNFFLFLVYFRRLAGTIELIDYTW